VVACAVGSYHGIVVLQTPVLDKVWWGMSTDPMACGSNGSLFKGTKNSSLDGQEAARCMALWQSRASSRVDAPKLHLHGICMCRYRLQETAVVVSRPTDSWQHGGWLLGTAADHVEHHNGDIVMCVLRWSSCSYVTAIKGGGGLQSPRGRQE
jgi:hypothetical protein